MKLMSRKVHIDDASSTGYRMLICSICWIGIVLLAWCYQEMGERYTALQEQQAQIDLFNKTEQGYEAARDEAEQISMPTYTHQLYSISELVNLLAPYEKELVSIEEGGWQQVEAIGFVPYTIQLHCEETSVESVLQTLLTDPWIKIQKVAVVRKDNVTEQVEVMIAFERYMHLGEQL